MNLTELKAIAADRTPGRWKYDWGNWDIEGPDRETLCCFDSGCREAGLEVPANGDGEFIAMAANYFDRLIAVAEAAEGITTSQVFRNVEGACYSEAVYNLVQALAALEAE